MSSQEITPPTISEVAQLMIFKTTWNRLPQKSFISGLWLRSYDHTKLWANCFTHILPVKDYPYFRHYFGNIILSTPGERGLWLDGSEEERISYALSLEQQSRGKTTARWNDVKALADDLKKEYRKNFPNVRGILIDYRYSMQEQQHVLGKMNKDFWKSF